MIFPAATNPASINLWHFAGLKEKRHQVSPRVPFFADLNSQGALGAKETHDGPHGVSRRWRRRASLADRCRRLPWACRRGLRLVCRLDLGGAARRTKFNNGAGDYATVLQNGLDEYLGKIIAVRAFYDASVEVDADEFALFTNQITAGQTTTCAGLGVRA